MEIERRGPLQDPGSRHLQRRGTASEYLDRRALLKGPRGVAREVIQPTLHLVARGRHSTKISGVDSQVDQPEEK